MIINNLGFFNESCYIWVWLIMLYRWRGGKDEVKIIASGELCIRRILQQENKGGSNLIYSFVLQRESRPRERAQQAFLGQVGDTRNSTQSLMSSRSHHQYHNCQEGHLYMCSIWITRVVCRLNKDKCH